MIIAHKINTIMESFSIYGTDQKRKKNSVVRFCPLFATVQPQGIQSYKPSLNVHTDLDTSGQALHVAKAN